MRILWFAVTPSLYSQSNLAHNGGGWISSLEKIIRQVPEIELGIAFEHADDCFRVERDSVIYYPMSNSGTKLNKFKKKFFYEPEEKRLLPICNKIISDFKPDIIQVFGSEWCFGLLTKYTKIPLVIHMQGSLPPYYNARFPPGYSSIDYVLRNGINIKNTYKSLLSEKKFYLQSIREEKILHGCQYFMGRTEWDKNIVKIYAPNSKYFYCNEALRDSFIENDEIWMQHERNLIVIVSTISSPLYKGLDVILKTAELIKKFLPINFEWRVFGTNEVQFHEWKTNISAKKVNVKLMGTVSAQSLKKELLNGDVFVHTSYIDNSPNSICEAQILGMPVVSTNVGGISTLIEHNKTGILVPANDPFTLASYIKTLIEDKEFATLLGRNAYMQALNRHNPTQIKNDLLEIYYSILNYEKINP